MSEKPKNKPWQIRLGFTLRKFFFALYKKTGLTQKQTIAYKEINKILIIRTDRLGDAVITTPLIKAIKANLPDKQLYILCSEQNRLIFKNNPFIDKLFIIDISPWLDYRIIKIPVLGPVFNFIYSLIYHFKDKKFTSVLRSLKSEKIDVVFDAVGRRRTAFLSRYLGKFTIGPKVSEIIFLYNYYPDYLWVDTTNKKHIIERYFDTFFKAIQL